MLNSLKHMWPDFLEIDFFKTIPKLDLPVYIFAGRSDYNTPFELAEQWAAVLEAPQVELVWFDDVAHMAPAEDPVAFQRALIDVLSPLH